MRNSKPTLQSDNTRVKERRSKLLSWMHRLRITVSLLFISLILGVALLIITTLYLRSQTLPVSTIIQTSEIYDIRGELIDSFYTGQNRQVVSLKDIAPSLIQATIAIEDHRFFEHLGIDPKGLARAIVTDVKTMSKEQGASTITQQLARNLYLNHDRTWGRKIKEAFYTVQLELKYSKDEILEQYLNQIYYGHSTYGAEAASQLFFSKKAKDLTLAESALLAGVPKGPKYFSPYLDMENAKNRQKLILNAMVREGYITDHAADLAYAEKLVITPPRPDHPSQAPFFQDYVRKEAIEKHGISESQYNTGGLKIYTTLDLKAQRAADEAITSQLGNESELQAALIAIDPRNGYIKAMVGGRDYQKNQFNRTLATTRQPGSSFKPILYLAALQNRFTPVTRYISEPTTFTYDDGKQTYTPSNFNNHYINDYIDLRRAIAESDNVYAVHSLLDVGPDKVIAMARAMGITSPLAPYPSLALGTYPVSPIEMASAFAIIANQGVKLAPTSIVRITDSRGNLLYEAKPLGKEIVKPAYTYVLTTLMQSVFEEGGTGYRVSDLLKRPAAGKTGTTNTDAWMVGFTPELATAVWIGYDRDRTISSVESRKAAPIFAQFTEKALEAIPPKLFPVPQGVTTVYIDPATGKLANDGCPNSRMETFVEGTEPTEYCVKQADSQSKNEEKTGSDKRNQTWWEDLKKWWNE